MKTNCLSDFILSEFNNSLGYEIDETDGFFDAGGDSLMAEEILMKVSKKMGREVPGWMLLDHPTAKEFANALSHELQTD